ncbi:hypothetical protein B296_00006502, partial [Ensete ventricosum]
KCGCIKVFFFLLFISSGSKNDQKDRVKQDITHLKHHLNAVPFTDEWVAAIETFGEYLTGSNLRSAQPGLSGKLRTSDHLIARSIPQTFRHPPIPPNPSAASSYDEEEDDHL